MKNKRFRIPIIGLICCMLLGTIAFAVNGRKITATYGGITIYLNGQKQVATDGNGKTGVIPNDVCADTCRQRMAGQNGYMAGQHQFCSHQ